MREPTRTLALTGAWTVFVTVSVLPVVLMLVGSVLTQGGAVSLAAYRGLVGDARQWQLLRTSLVLAGGATAIATALGVPVGFTLARVPLRGAHVWRLLLLAPLAIPPYVMALAWMLATGPVGPLARVVPPDVLGRWAYSTSAAAITLGVCFFPLGMLGTEAALRRVSGRGEDAARLVAAPVRVFTRITLPLVAPTISAALLMVFTLALTEFSVPGLLRVRVYTTEVFTAFSAYYDFARATALAIPLMIAVLVLAGGTTFAVQSGPRSGPRSSASSKVDSPRARRVALAAVVTASTLTVLGPLAILAWDATTAVRVTTAVAGATPVAGTSVLIAAVTACSVIVVASVLGYARAHGTRWGSWLDLLCVWLFAVPSTVVGIGLIAVWNRPGVGIAYGTPAMLVLAAAARSLPLAVLLMGAAGRQLSPALEEAAALSGASWGRVWRRIWLPQLRWALGAVWGISFVLAFGELGASVLVIPPRTMTLPVHVYTMVANAAPGQLALLALVQAAVALAGLGAAAFAVSRNPSWTG